MYLIQTVQTTWRPQLPLPKELHLTDERNSADDDTKPKSATSATAAKTNDNLDELEMDRLRSHQQHSSLSGGGGVGSGQQLSNKQKWSFGRIFRNKKKEAENNSASSSEEDRKAGFVPKSKAKKSIRNSSSHKTLGFDHIVLPAAAATPPQNHQLHDEFFLPVEMVPPEPYYQNQPGYNSRSSNSLDRRLYLSQQQQQQQLLPSQKSRSTQRVSRKPGHSSEEELISLNSSTFSKYRSDESIHSGGQALSGGPSSRRSRAARNERYYKRLSRDGEISHGGVPHQQQQRYKTQPLPLSIYQATNSSASPAYVQWRPLQNSMQNDAKRSISYDSQIHLQNASGGRRMSSKPVLPPPPPPRDPLRRVHIGCSSGDLRPVSYAFDQCGRCVSDDRMWQPPHYQSVHSLNSQPGSTNSEQASQSQPHHRRFITRSERNALPGKKSLPNGIVDFHYMADATPRSRKPIHMLDTSGAAAADGSQSGLPAYSGVLRTSKSGLPTSNETWKQPLAKPRSISSSRISELRSYPMPMYSEVQKPKRSAPAPAPAPEPDNVICGSLRIKPGEHGSQNYVEIRHRDVHKTNSMPHHYQQRRSGEDLPNKYEEYVAEKREQHQQAPPAIFSERKNSLPAPPIYLPRKKPANLEEAINELEAIYKSLGLTEPAETVESKAELKKEPKPRMPTPSDFEKFALAHADDYEDEDSPGGEPDPVRDDVAYRNLQLSNLQHRHADRQPPFGIPVGPIVPAPQSDYLHVEPVQQPKKKTGSPDIVKDDLAVRALRKDPPGPKSTYVYPVQSKKQRATRTQSANIYSLIQRAAAKPSGGDLGSYMELTRSIERAGSMSNLCGSEEEEKKNDIPCTLDLLRKLKAQDEELAKKPHIPFRHPSLGGAIAQLPERLGQEETATPKLAPVPAPRKSLTPEPLLEDALNKIAQDAQASSIKLTQELDELRKEALITAARPKLNAEQQKLEQELQQIEAVSVAAKRCGQLLLETLPDQDRTDSQQQAGGNQQRPNPRKLHKEGKLIRAIDEVSEAANAVCEKILKDIVTTEPPVVVHEARQVKQQPAAHQQQLVMPHLIKKLDPIQSEKIEAIAKRCMRQLSELAEAQPPPDYDNLANCNTLSTAGAAVVAGCEQQQQVHADATLICPIAEARAATAIAAATTTTAPNEDIDRIMLECERQARQTATNNNSSSSMTTVTTTSGTGTDDQRTTAPSMSSGGGGATVSTTASSFSSSSDCLAKSTSPSNVGRALSSSITSFNPYSSSDYIKSQSSDYHAPSTDPIKTFSTTSYDVQSTRSNSTNNNNNSTLSTNSNNNSTLSTNNNNSNTSENQTASVASPSPSPSPPLQLTPVGERRARSSSPSQYNSSEELAAIFGIEEKPKQKQKQKQRKPATGKGLVPAQQLGQVQSECQELSSSDAATNPRSALVQATTTNPVLNVDPQIDVITTTTTTSTTSSSSYSPDNTQSTSTNASNCSSHSCKLATIPELELELEQDTEREQEKQAELKKETEPETKTNLKLSPNFNRIYASNISIVMDRPQLQQVATAPATNVTQFDSLSSLGEEEEISSNPDSGNASLADFPLSTAQTNNSIELQTTYNSRFEVKEHYVTQVSINAIVIDNDIERKKKPLVSDGEEEFPRLPTEEELLEGLREQAKLGQDQHRTGKPDDNLKLDEAVYDLARGALLKEDQQQLEENEHKIGEDKLDDISKFDETLALSVAVYDLASEALIKEQPALDDAELVASALDEALLIELDECDPVELTESIVYETPQIKLSISELKLNYETETRAATLPDAIKEEINNEAGKNDVPIKDTLARNEQQRSRNENETTQRRQGLPALANSVAGVDVVDDADADDELPTTSSKALSVFGELRTLHAPAEMAGARLTRGGLTTLEHIVFACTVGLITPNDLLTLCLIVIGVIIIVAIALS
ncbi:uncharacterized protein LOC6558750 [Drosophila grimshawi]|uniref:uncharacterized protein LOC6558750 n=1 Tax=Drosophila grimshawi TaxID=7222 RepID=UPI000C871745|nr:uncharacterized protein LOC6558750 [Drosophila grimshawi]